jgi:hypothetical protein
MSRNRFQLIERYRHFNDNNAAETKEDRLNKIITILEIVSELIIYQIGKFLLTKVCLVGGVVCDFGVFNPGKITKYGIPVRMVCESSKEYICILQIYDGKCRTLTEKVGFFSSLLKGMVTTCTKTIITSVHQRIKLLQKLIEVCGTMRVNRRLTERKDKTERQERAPPQT